MAPVGWGWADSELAERGVSSRLELLRVLFRSCGYLCWVTVIAFPWPGSRAVSAVAAGWPANLMGKPLYMDDNFKLLQELIKKFSIGIA